VSPVFSQSVRHTDGLRRVRVDDRQFAAFGEELSSFVPGQGLSTCVSGAFPLCIPEASIRVDFFFFE